MYFKGNREVSGFKGLILPLIKEFNHKDTTKAAMEKSS